MFMYVRIIMKHLFHLIKIMIDFCNDIWYNTYIVKKGDTNNEKARKKRFNL